MPAAFAATLRASFDAAMPISRAMAGLSAAQRPIMPLTATITIDDVFAQSDKHTISRLRRCALSPRLDTA